MRVPDQCEFDRRLQRTPGYDDRALAHVVNSADAIQAGWPSAADGFLRHIAAETPRATPAQRIAHVFARGLLARLAGAECRGKNVYFEEPHPGATLTALQKLVEALPQVRFGYSAANAAILQGVAGRRAVHVVDVGIGSGGQWFGFLKQLAQQAGPAPRMRLTAIDSVASPDDPTRRLDQVGEALRNHAEELGVRFAFQPVVAQAQDMDFSLLERRPGEALAINAVDALHRIPTTDGGDGREDSRSLVLRRLYEARPDVLAMVERDAEHNALPLNLLARESIAYYLTVFDALAALLPGDLVARQTLERAFFGREILNIVSLDGVRRLERHERHANWRRRLRAHGFAPVAPALPIAFDPEAACGMPISVRTRRDGLFLTWKNRPLVAATAWTPRYRRAA